MSFDSCEARPAAVFLTLSPSAFDLDVLNASKRKGVSRTSPLIISPQRGAQSRLPPALLCSSCFFSQHILDSLHRCHRSRSLPSFPYEGHFRKDIPSWPMAVFYALAVIRSFCARATLFSAISSLSRFFRALFRNALPPPRKTSPDHFSALVSFLYLQFVGSFEDFFPPSYPQLFLLVQGFFDRLTPSVPRRRKTRCPFGLF